MQNLHEYLNNIKICLFEISMFVLFVAGLCRLVVDEIKRLKK